MCRHLRLNSLAEVDAIMTSHKIVIASDNALAYSLVTLVLTTAAALVFWFCAEDADACVVA